MTEIFQKFENVSVKSIDSAVNDYCGTDEHKKARIINLLEKCKEENLPIIAEELLAPMVQSRNNGYYFHASVQVENLVNLPQLTSHAVACNMDPARRTLSIPSLNDDEDLLKYVQFKPLSTNGEFCQTSADLFAFYSATTEGDEAQTISQESREFFNKLADKTVDAWEAFFKKSINFNCEKDDPMYQAMLHIGLHDMVNTVQMRPITEQYNANIGYKDQYTYVLNTKNDTLEAFTPEGEKVSVLSGLATIDALKGEKNERYLYCDGQPTGIKKIFTRTWEKTFKEYLVKQNEQQQKKEPSELGPTPNRPTEELAKESDSLLNIKEKLSEVMTKISPMITYSPSRESDDALSRYLGGLETDKMRVFISEKLSEAVNSSVQNEKVVEEVYNYYTNQLDQGQPSGGMCGEFCALMVDELLKSPITGVKNFSIIEYDFGAGREHSVLKITTNTGETLYADPTRNKIYLESSELPVMYRGSRNVNTSYITLEEEKEFNKSLKLNIKSEFEFSKKPEEDSENNLFTQARP